MKSGNEHESEPTLSPGANRALDGLRGEFRATHARAVDTAMRRVRQEAELRTRMGATVRTRAPGRSWAYQRAGLAAATFAIVALAGFAGMGRFAQPAHTGTQSVPSQSASSLAEQIAGAQPGATVVLAERATIQAIGKPLRFDKKVRIEVAATFHN